MNMQIRRDPHHLIDVLFPAALLFVFAFSAVSVILLATGVYRDTGDPFFPELYGGDGAGIPDGESTSE